MDKPIANSPTITQSLSPDGSQVLLNGVVFTGDTGKGGSAGLVPAPGAGDAAAGKVLGAGNAWIIPPGGNPGIVKGTPFTLPAGVTSLTVTPAIALAAGACLPTSEVILIPRTPDAALETTFFVVTAGDGMFEIACANSPAVDMLLQFLIVI